MKILTVSDEECAALWDHYVPGRLKEYDLILSCGDLNARYLSFLVTMARCPLLYVHGNHDTNYRQVPPEGCDCIDDHIVTYNGVRRRIQKLKWKLKRMGGVDIVVTHAPPYGLGDGDDPAHWGFESLVGLLDTYHPKYLVHGHVHLRYGARDRVRDYNGTTLINATERYTFEIPDRPVDGKELGQVIYKTRQGRDDPLGRC